MSDPRIKKFAQLLIEHSARINPGDRVLLEATTAAEPLVRELYTQILEKGGHPHPMLMLPGTLPFIQDDLFLANANHRQLDYIPPFYKLAYEEFESRIRIHSATNTRAMTNADPEKNQRYSKVLGQLTQTQFRRGAEGSFKWVTTLFPTDGYAQDANMSLSEYEDFVYRAVHADQDDPIAYWQSQEESQQAAIDHIQGHDQVILRGPNVDLTLSIKDRIFKNSTGVFNMPDGEIYTGPVEKSVNGWVRFTYPAIYGGVAVEGAELTFKDGRVVEAKADKNLDYLQKMLETDAGACYLGEFAIGTNSDIDRFTGHILLDEKIDGSFHMAIGAGYPETGSVNKSAIHWDMICDLRTDSEILVDGDLFYKNGKFAF
ncbi:MAG: aminopeptidase [Anaerolineales bacterium]|nr:aminopeptidase [Anaerolineales bacterium]